jgi:hypothetical protein
VKVYLFEQIKQDSTTFARSVCQYIGVSDEDAETLFNKKVFRPKLNEFQLNEFLIFGRHRRLMRIYRQILNKMRFYDFIKKTPFGKPISTVLSPENTTLLMKKFYQGNEKLTKATGLHLKEQGYY